MSWLTRLFKRNTGVPYQGWNFSECGPTALSDVLSHRAGRLISRYQCRNQKPTPSWWTAKDLVYVGNKLGGGFQIAHYSMTANAGIYLSTYLGFGHWVVAWKGSDNRIHVRDPKRGYYIVTESQFRPTLKSWTYVHTNVRF